MLSHTPLLLARRRGLFYNRKTTGPGAALLHRLRAQQAASVRQRLSLSRLSECMTESNALQIDLSVSRKLLTHAAYRSVKQKKNVMLNPSVQK